MLRGFDLWRISAREVWRRRRRYSGVASGLALGTMGFIVMLSLGRDVRDHIHRDLDLLGGATMVKMKVVSKSGHGEGESIAPAALAEFRSFSDVQAVSAAAINLVPVSIELDQRACTATALGVDEYFWKGNSFVAVEGRLFSAEEVRGRERVCVLGAALARRLCGEVSPVGRWVRVRRDLYRVCGLLEGAGVGDRDEFIFFPLTTARDRLRGMSPSNRLYIRCVALADVEPVVDRIPAVMAEHQPSVEFQINVPWTQLRYVRRLLNWIETFILVSVIVTLGLGGLGIWTGMLSAVRSRTREIGLKKAMGADDGDIRAQFLSEALCLSLGAAALGILGGRIVMVVVVDVLHSVMPERLFLVCTALGLLLSLALGLVAGYWPALQASRMDAVCAMHDE